MQSQSAASLVSDYGQHVKHLMGNSIKTKSCTLYTIKVADKETPREAW